MPRILSVNSFTVEIGLEDGSIIDVDLELLDFKPRRGDVVEVYGDKTNPVVMLPANYRRKGQALRVFLVVALIITIFPITFFLVTQFTGLMTSQRVIEYEPSKNQSSVSNTNSSTQSVITTGLELVNNSIDVDDSSVFPKFEGIIKNNSNRDYSFVSIRIYLYDKDGNLIDTVSDYTSTLKAGGTWKFSSITLEQDFATFELAEITGDPN